jgi:hypothetical protein
MSQLTRGLEGVICHMDDKLVFCSSMEEHDKLLRAVLKRIEEGGVTLNSEKWEYGPLG